MKTISFQYKTELAFSSPASDHRFILRIEPGSDDRQQIKTLSWHIDPPGVLWHTTDGFGNKVLSGRIDPPHDHFRFGIEGKAEVSSEPFTLCANQIRALLYPSPLTQPNKELIDFYNALNRNAPAASDSVGDTLQRLEYFSRAVNNRMRYERGSTTPKTTASEAFSIGAGVCQDYTHILLALLRLDGIASRYVAGLASDYGETHAWAEAQIGNLYCGIDPTRDKFIDEGYIAISHGRDFDDCSIERGSFKGMCGGTQTISLNMQVPQ